MKKTTTLLLLICMSFPMLAQQSFTLDEAVAYGIENQNALRMSEIDVVSADQDIKEFRAIGMPKVSGAIDYNYYFYVPKQPVPDFISPAVYNILEMEGLPDLSPDNKWAQQVIQGFEKLSKYEKE